MRQLILIIIIFFIFTANGLALDVQRHQLEVCGDNNIRILFLCDSSWRTERLENAILMIIDSDPLATVTIAQIDTEIKYLSQLSDQFLEKRDLYKKGFITSRVKLGQRDAIEVKAFSKKSERRILDYFFIHNDSLYGLLFSVYPKTEWDEYKFLIKQIIDSFAFVE